MLTWLLCAALTAGLLSVWRARPEDLGNAASVAGAVVGLFGVLAVWAWRPGPRSGRSSSQQVDEAAQVLARLVLRQWQDEAVLRQLFDPAPLPVVWSDSALPGVSDHRELIGDPITCRADATQELAAAFRGLPRRRLVALGPAGSGKTTLAVLLTLALLRDRSANEPVPVLLSLASFDPSRDSVQTWLRRRIAADRPVLTETDTYGPTAIEDLLADGRILPVLDGLDEPPTPGHAAMLAALNDTLDAHAPLVLTCRTTDYTAAVAAAGVLAGAAVVEPTPVHADEALALLRLATPPGPRQERWDALAGHLTHHPQGATAQALASPLMVALARAVYADAPGDPAELTDTGRFPTPAAVEHHLLDGLVPVLYTRAHRQNPAVHRWDPHRAHRYLGYLAAGLQRRGTHDLAWWQLYRWVPSVARSGLRAVVWGTAATMISFPLFLTQVDRQIGGAAVLATLLEISPWVTALIWVLAVGSWSTTRPWGAARPVAAALATSVCGGLAGGAVSLWVEGAVRGDVDASAASLVQSLLRSACWIGFSLLMILLGSGPPTPPRTPSQGAFTLRHWRRRLRRAAATVGLAAVFGGAALYLYGVVKLYGVADETTWRTAWPYGLVFGTAIGTGPAVLRWTRDTATVHDLTTPLSSIRADRLVALANGVVGTLLIAVSGAAMDAFEGADASIADHRPAEVFTWSLLHTGAVGLSLALAAYAWPHYTAARVLLAARTRLPWRLQTFLADAHRLGILRQVGSVYQFRHARLQHHLATAHTRTPPR
ncbi:NACHT domain-containing protein [Streptomyces rimosus]|uniref:NACHT domain-containing protein n=1 Tax=Streptomyces rimosus TaxID=1927 RepID=UPI0004C4B267|nr:NACHT domain-containing protein [Streptomyces rimosus]